ncbi:MAG: sensor histidine kinase [Acidisphaera sp.]|nr:sensor histidine kinase [Acidisphaera sp.]
MHLWAHDLVLVAVGLATAFAAGMALRAHHLTRALARAETARDQAQAGEAAVTRLMALSANELRLPAMTLLGHAERLRSEHGDTTGHAVSITMLTAQILTLADDLQDRAVPLRAERVLREEAIRMAPLIAEAIAAVNATLGPSRRNWRVSEEFSHLSLTADRRAVRQILTRVLANAARFTAHGDWIELFPEHRTDTLALIIEDEGAGVASPDPALAAGFVDSRGIGLGLALARALIEAHGGRLVVESTTSVGTRVSLVFPARRVRLDPASHTHGDRAIAPVGARSAVAG